MAFQTRFAALSALVFAAGAALAGCAQSDDASGSEEDLTSLTARARILTFEGVVYVAKGTKDDKVLEAVHAQTKTAFGALLHSEIAAQTREFQNVNPASLKRRDVLVVDTAKTGDPGKEMVEVRYTYTDNAVVPVKMSQKTSLPLAVLGQGSEAQLPQITELCTKNDKEARDDVEGGLIWYVFDPSRAPCRRAADKEQKTIDADTAKLADAKKMVSLSRVNRTYVPTTMQFARSEANTTRAVFPEYDRMFAGPSEPGVLTIALVVGRMEHERVEARKDEGYFEWMDTLNVLFTDHPDFTLTKIEPEENLTSISAEGKQFNNLKFTDFIQWTVFGRGFPEGMPASSRDNIQKTVANKLDLHWVTFEKKTKVSVAGGPPKDLTIRLETIFGPEDEEGAIPHKRAMKRGDVVIYNGHSYIGEGPWDPANFDNKSFTNGYQILFFDSCVSYNYYEKDFFSLKPNGLKDLDLITNALESPTFQSGAAEGAFISKMISGNHPSYQTLLESAKATDALRVVDGEIDNKFDPRAKSVKFVK